MEHGCGFLETPGYGWDKARLKCAKLSFNVQPQNFSMTYKKIVNGLTVLGLVFIFIMPNEAVSLLIELFHFILELLLELAHLMFEWAEVTLDHIIELLFDTDLHDTQIIVFYILLSIICYGIYRLCRVVPGMFLRMQSYLIALWEFNKIRAYLYWRGLPLIEQLKLVAIFAIGIIGFIFLNF